MLWNVFFFFILLFSSIFFYGFIFGRVIDIEEITQKAGNYKKFPVFVKMLKSAFSKESDSVIIDLLTYNDLELLKARKTGSLLNSSTSSVSRAHSKRYIILTYSGEFDRTHFPLPLQYEDSVDLNSMQRTIKRLKKQLLEKTVSDLEHSTNRADRYFYYYVVLSHQ